MTAPTRRGQRPDTTHDEALRYSLPAHDGAVWLGLRLPALTVLVLTVLLAVTGLVAGVPVLVIPPVLILGGCGALLTHAGRPLPEWLPTLAGHLRNQQPGRATWSAPILTPPPAPPGQGPRTGRSGSRDTVTLPTEYGHRRLVDLHDSQDADGAGGTRIGVIETRHGDTVTAVLAVAGTDRFALLDPAGQDQQLARWGNALTALAADPRIRTVQWVQRTAPHTADTGAWLTDRHTSRAAGPPPAMAGPADPDGTQPGDAPVLTADDALAADAGALRDYVAMTGALERAAVTQQTWLAVEIARHPAEWSRHSDAGPASHNSSQLIDQLREIAGTLLGADLVARPLSAAELGWVLRCGTDLQAAGLRTDTSADAGDTATDASGGQLGPRSRKLAWDHLRTDDTFHRSFTVTGWPRLPMPADWLAPLLLTALPALAIRTLAVHLTPVAAHTAVRQARAANGKARLDARDRNRLGFTDSARETWAEQEALDLEQELLGGYRMHRLAAVLTVSAPDLVALDDASRAVQAAAAANRIDLRALHGQHHRGLIATLPLCTIPTGRSPR